MSYIGKLQIDDGSILPVASSLYGICNTAPAISAKRVALENFDKLQDGVTVHVRFTYGNTAEFNNALTLLIGSTPAKPIRNPGGSVSWSEGSVISFTYDSTFDIWQVNDGNVTTITVLNTYTPTSTEGISGQGVADALETLGEAAQKDIISTIVDYGANTNKNSTNLPTTAAVTAYVDSKTQALQNAMHYIGRTNTEMTDGLTTASVVINGLAHTPQNGDVVLSLNTHQEFIWVEIDSTLHTGYWELLGDEGTYALNSNTAQVIDNITFNGGTPTEVTLKSSTTPVITSISNNNVARAASAVIENGILKITTGILHSFNTAQIQEIDSVSTGTSATLSSHTKEVIVPYTA